MWGPRCSQRMRKLDDKWKKVQEQQIDWSGFRGRNEMIKNMGLI